MELTTEDRAILAHVVVDPDAWAAHAENTVGAEAVRVKIEKYRDEYHAERALPEYQTRAEREAAARAAMETRNATP